MKQHYLPRFYLKNWKVKVKHWDNQIWLYERDKEPKHCSIQKNAGVSVNFYGIKLKDGTIDNTSVEAQLSAIESQTAPVFSKVINRERLSIEDKQKLAEFISIFWRRVPFHRQDYKRKLTEFIPEYFSNLYRELKILGVTESDSRFIQIQNIEKQYNKKIPDQFYAGDVLRKSIMTDALVQMDWGFIVAPTDTKFATSDNPFVFSRGTGLGNLETGLVLFPISPELVLQALWKSKYNGKYVPVFDSHAREVNKRIVSNAFQQVFLNKQSNVFAEFVKKWIASELPS